MPVENGAQFLNPRSAPLPEAAVTPPVTKINASEQSQKLDLILSA